MSDLRDEIENALRDCPVDEVVSRCVGVLAAHLRPEDFRDHLEVSVRPGIRPLEYYLHFEAKTEFGRAVVVEAYGEERAEEARVKRP